MTRPKFRPCTQCQTPNQANRKTCFVCHQTLSTKKKLKEKVQTFNGQWRETVLKNRNVSRVIDSAQIAQRLANRRITFFCMDVTCKYWPYLEKVSKSCPELQHLLQMKPFLSVFHAKAHDFKCEAKWSGAYQDGAGLTLGEEVEQCNAFLSRIAVTTKHMSKAGRTDMLTLMAMRWNQQKLDNLATTLTHRYQKATKALQKQHQNLESLKTELLVTDSQLNVWVHDIKDWAEATSSTTDPDSLAGRIEVLAASIKRRSQRLYKDTDGNKARAKTRHKIRKEKNILALALEDYNKTVTSTEALSLEEILSGDTTLPWQQPHSDSVSLATKRRAFDGIMAVKRLEEEKRILVEEMDRHWKSLSSYEDTLKELSRLLSRGKFKSTSCPLNDEGLGGLQSIILRELQHLKQMKLQAREYYLQTLSGAESVSFDDTSDDDFGSDSEASDNSL